ncbi:hypothetical protein B296_00010488 [Ensete ventricosum]|uniref:Uncharacterized protein n=1 Tax=Ensete ventricosum TaxID=4639 RepID=A0A426Z8J8_ENSVE|nr:hypothetical protein B296_00010488 [Ensete ventricosum]
MTWLGGCVWARACHSPNRNELCLRGTPSSLLLSQPNAGRTRSTAVNAGAVVVPHMQRIIRTCVAPDLRQTPALSAYPAPPFPRPCDPTIRRRSPLQRGCGNRTAVTAPRPPRYQKARYRRRFVELLVLISHHLTFNSFFLVHFVMLCSISPVWVCNKLMANMRAAANMRSSAPGAKQSFLPPRCPLPTVSPSYGDCGSLGPRGIPRPKEGQRHHQRTSSESFLIEEQPLWLDDLLNEPETPVRRGAHRRSTSDSFAYLDGVSLSNIGSVGQEQQSFPALSPWMSQELNHHKDVGHFSYYPEANSSGRPQLKAWESAVDVVIYSGSTLLANEKMIHPQPSCVQTESDALNPDVVEKNEHLDGAQDKKGPFEKKEDSHSKQTEVDSKRVKQ